MSAQGQGSQRLRQPGERKRFQQSILRMLAAQILVAVEVEVAGFELECRLASRYV